MVKAILVGAIVAPAAALAVPLGAPALATSSVRAGAYVASTAACHGPADFGATYLGAIWPGGFRAVPVYSNGISGSFMACMHSTRTPRGVWVADGYEWQCVELVNRLYLTKGWINSVWLGNGNMMYRNAPSFLAKQPQGRISYVHPGDVISFNSPWGGAGHAAVVARVQGSYLTIANQNTSRASTISNAYLSHGRIVMVGWPGWAPIGVVHAPTKPSAAVVKPLGIAAATLPHGTVNDAYAASVRATGGTGGDRLFVSGGSIPTGLSLTRSGTLKGTALSSGGFPFDVTVRDSAGKTATRAYFVRVDPGGNLLAAAAFQSSTISPWKPLPAGSRDIVHATAESGVTGAPVGSHALKLSSSTVGGSVYQDSTSFVSNGASASMSGWVRSHGGIGHARVCLVLSARPGTTFGRSCNTVGAKWVHLVAPLDVHTNGVWFLRSQVVVETAGGVVDVTGTQLVGNALHHASFAGHVATGWVLRRAPAGGRVNGRIYSASGLPQGSTEFELNSSVPGGSLYQDVAGRLYRGQSYMLTAEVRAHWGTGSAKVCLVLWSLGHTHVSQNCQRIGTGWALLAVPFAVNTLGETGLRAQLIVKTSNQNVDVNGMSLEDASLRNSGFTNSSSSWQLTSGDAARMVGATSTVSAGLPAGSHYLAVTSAGSGSTVHQDVTTTSRAGQSYDFSTWVRAHSGSARARVCISLSSGAGGQNGKTCLAVGPRWQLVAAPFTAQSGTHTLRAQATVRTSGVQVDLAGTTMAAQP